MHSLRRSEIVYCVNPRHPFAQEKTLPLVKTALEPLVEIKESFHFREQILQQYQEAGCTPGCCGPRTSCIPRFRLSNPAWPMVSCTGKLPKKNRTWYPFPWIPHALRY